MFSIAAFCLHSLFSIHSFFVHFVAQSPPSHSFLQAPSLPQATTVANDKPQANVLNKFIRVKIYIPHKDNNLSHFQRKMVLIFYYIPDFLKIPQAQSPLGLAGHSPFVTSKWRELKSMKRHPWQRNSAVDNHSTIIKSF